MALEALLNLVILIGLVLILVLTSVLLWLTMVWMQQLGKRSSQKVPQIYSQPGFFYPLKYKIILLMLRLRKFQNARKQKLRQANSTGAGYGIRSRNSLQEMDSMQALPEDQPKAVDAVYFNGGNAEGVYLVAATARRQENIVQTILYLQLPRIGLLEITSLPDTWLSDPNSAYGYTAGGLTIKPLRPMETWSLTYDGMMRIVETERVVKVTFNLIWRAKTKYFDFDTDLHPHVMADGLAREKWSREFFNTLNRAHQTHYEQFGEITGPVHVSSFQVQDIRVQGVRDHSYGNIRDWALFHRYALNYAYLENGVSLCVGAICMPSTLSRLVVGYWFNPDGTMEPVESTDFEFFHLGDDGVPPTTFTLNFKAGDRQHSLVCEVLHSPIFYMGKEWDAKIHERFCKYTVDGIKGWGISEWDYRNYDGKQLELKRLKETRR